MSDDAILIRIDGIEYRVRDLSQYVEKVLEKTVKDQQEMLSYLDDMTVDIVGSDDALKEMPRLEADPYVRQKSRRFLVKTLPAILVEEDIRKKVNPSVDDLMKQLPDPAAMYEVSVIVCEERSKVDLVQKALRAGESFADLAKKHSDGISAEKGGRIEPLEEGKHTLFTPDEFRIIRALKDGEVSSPFHTRIGWIVVKMEKAWSPGMLKRRDIANRHAQYRADAQGKAVKEMIDRLHEQAKIAWDDDVLARVRSTLSGNRPFSEKLMTEVVLRVNGSPIHVLELEPLSKVHSPESLDLFMERRVRDELLTQEAERRGYGKKAAKIADVARKRAVTRRYFHLKAKSIAVSDEDLRAYHRKNPGKFMTDEFRSLLVVETASERKAREVAGKARKGGDFRELAARYSEKEEQRKVRGELGYVSRKNLHPRVGEKVFAAREGSVVGPLPMKDPAGKKLFVVVKVEHVAKPEPIPFEKLDRDVLTDRIVSGEMESFYVKFFEKAYRGHKLESFVKKGQGRRSDGNAVNL